MNERRDEQWLDNELQHVIGQTGVRFDAEIWKREHAEAYQALANRRGRGGRAKIAHPWRRVFIGHMGRLAVAAAIVVVGTLAFLAPGPKTPGRIATPPPGPTDIVTFKSLTLAYRRGGEEGMNRQLDAAQETLGPRPDHSLLSDLLDDIRG